MSLNYIKVRKNHYKSPPSDKVIIYQADSWKDSHSMWADGAIVTEPGNSIFSRGKIQVEGEIIFEIEKVKTKILAEVPITGELSILNEGSHNSNGYVYMKLRADLSDEKNKIIFTLTLNETRIAEGVTKIDKTKSKTMELDPGLYHWKLFLEFQSEARKGWQGRVTALLSRIDLKILGC